LKNSSESGTRRNRRPAGDPYRDPNSQELCSGLKCSISCGFTPCAGTSSVLRKHYTLWSPGQHSGKLTAFAANNSPSDLGRVDVRRTAVEIHGAESIKWYQSSEKVARLLPASTRRQTWRWPGILSSVTKGTTMKSMTVSLKAMAFWRRLVWAS